MFSQQFSQDKSSLKVSSHRKFVSQGSLIGIKIFSLSFQIGNFKTFVTFLQMLQ